MNNKLLGLVCKQEIIVHEALTAKNVESGSLDVLATPALITLIEKTAWQCVEPFLDQNETTVGTFVSVNHTKPTPLGLKVTCLTEVVEVNGREITFLSTCFDEIEQIANATHKRFIINIEKFQNKVLKKTNQ